MIQYKLIDFGVREGACTARFKVVVGEGTKPFEASFTGTIEKDGPTFLKAAGVALMKRYLPPSKFEGDLRLAVGEGHVYEILDPSKEPHLIEDEEEGDAEGVDEAGGN